MGHGKHVRKSDTNYRAATAIALGAGVVVTPIAFASSSSAATASEWDCIAKYESGSVWNLPYGDADSTGGLQIQDRTWADFGGLSIAPHAYQATKAQQIAVAEKILAAQGQSAWTTNGRCGGLSRTPYVGTATPSSVVPSVTATVTVGGVPSPKVGSKAYLAVQYAKGHISNAAYLWGGNGPTRFDCSGLTSQAWKAAGVDFTGKARTSFAQEKLPQYVSGATYVTKANLRPGDLVAYNGFSGGHVAMYVGPIGPNGADLIDTASSHPNGGVGWSKMATRGSTPTGYVRPAPFVPASGTPSTTPPATGGSYTVKSGDSLSKIATAKNVKGGWQALYAANKAAIGSNPNLIHPGLVLKLPA